MRLGSQLTRLIPNTLAHQVYGSEVITERHRHRYEFNNRYQNILEQAGMVFSGRSSDGQLAEMIELPEHPWFLGCQFHPEFTSNPRDGHPLFIGFIQAALAYQQGESVATPEVVNL